jgi:hypothetical protein
MLGPVPVIIRVISLNILCVIKCVQLLHNVEISVIIS